MMRASTLRRSPLLLLAAALVALAVFLTGDGVPPAQAQSRGPGDLDTTFSTDGIVTTDISSGTGEDEANAVAVQGFGKIVVAGSSDADFALARYTNAGALDTTFGTGGKVTTAIGSAGAVARAMAVQDDGKIVVAGSSRNVGDTDDFALARYTSAGALDTTFGTGGKVTTAIGTGNDYGRAMAVQDDGKIVVAGYSYVGFSSDIALARYTSAGALDTTFGTGGKVTTAIGSGNDFARAMAIDGDGKIVVAGSSRNVGDTDDFALARYTSAGALDTTFGTGGKVTTAISSGTGADEANAVALQSDGKIVVAGIANNDIALARYLGDPPPPPDVESWAPDMRVHKLGGEKLGCSNNVPGARCGDINTLEGDGFSYQQATYRVNELYVAPQGTNSWGRTYYRVVLAMSNYLPPGSVLNMSWPSKTSDGNGRRPDIEMEFPISSATRDGATLTWNRVYLDTGWDPYPANGQNSTVVTLGLERPRATIANILVYYDGVATSDTVEIRDATLTAGSFGTSPYIIAGCDNDNTGVECSSTSNLTEDSFTYDSVDYEVVTLGVVLADGTLYIKLNRAISSSLKSDLTLHVDGTQFPLADATLTLSDKQASWSNTGLGWSVGDTVQLRLTATELELGADDFSHVVAAHRTHYGYSAVLPGEFPSIDPEKGVILTTHVKVRVAAAHSGNTIRLGKVTSYTSNVDYSNPLADPPIVCEPIWYHYHCRSIAWQSVADGGLSEVIELNPLFPITNVRVEVTDGDSVETYLLSIDPPPRTYSLTPSVQVAEGEDAVLTLALSRAAPTVGARFTVTTAHPAGGASTDDVGVAPTTVTVPEGEDSVEIRIPTVNDDLHEPDESFTVTIADNDDAPVEPTPPDGIEPWDIQVVPGDDTLTVTWQVNPRDGVEDSDIRHALRWSQEPGVWANPIDPRGIGRNDGITVEGGVTSYLITGLTNDVATGVFVRSFTGDNRLETAQASSDWVRTKGEHTTPEAGQQQQQQAPPGITVTADNPLGVSEDGSGTYTVTLDSEPTADVTLTATSSDAGAASVSPASHTFTAANWYEPATFTVSGVADDDTNDESVGVSHSVTSQDSDYENVLVPSVSVAVTDTTQEQEQQQDSDDGNYADLIADVYQWRNDPAWVNDRAHTDRWDRVLLALGEDVSDETLTPMTAAEAQELADKGWQRWVRVAEALTEIEGGGQQQEPTNTVPTVSSAIADATIVNESGTRQVSLSGVFSDGDGDALTVTAQPSDTTIATVSVSADHSTLTVSAQARGTATVTVTADDGNGGTVSDSFTVTVKAAPVVASAIADVSGLTAGNSQDVSLSGAFSDADGDSLTITASSSDTAKATVSMASDGSKLTLTGVAEGTATVTVTAQDSDGNTASDAFEVSVAQATQPEEPQAPEQKDYSELIAKVREWRSDPQWVDNKTHTDRWDRVLLALGETVEDKTLTPMTAAEAQTYADRGWARWVEVAKALKEIEGG